MVTRIDLRTSTHLHADATFADEEQDAPHGTRGILSFRRAGVAQLVEQLIRNQQVVGSSPTAGSSLSKVRTFC